jgi:hypothetical protein
VANQVNGAYEAKEESMKAYVKQAKKLKASFEAFTLTQISRTQNKRADALSKLASLAFAHLTKRVLVEVLEEKSVKSKEVQDVVVEEDDTWMTLIQTYLSTAFLPENEDEATRIRLKATQHTMDGGIMLKNSYLAPLLRCVGPGQSNYLIREVHAGVCGTHAGPRNVVSKS